MADFFPDDEKEAFLRTVRIAIRDSRSFDLECPLMSLPSVFETTLDSVPWPGAYLGAGDRFDRALCDFAVAYADQNEKDFAALERAIAANEVHAVTGL